MSSVKEHELKDSPLYKSILEGVSDDITKVEVNVEEGYVAIRISPFAHRVAQHLDTNHSYT